MQVRTARGLVNINEMPDDVTELKAQVQQLLATQTQLLAQVISMHANGRQSVFM